MPFRTAHRIVGRIAASGRRPGLAELDEIALEMAGFRASERGFSEADLEGALDPRSNVALRGPEWELYLCSSPAFFPPGRREVVHHIRTLLACDEIARFVFGQAFARGPGFP
jgi:hypothetical protein